jgi:GxxExxY protein
MNADVEKKSLNDNRDPETYAILGVAMEVHRELGSGFLESVYQDALETEFGLRSIPYSREHAVPVYYKGEQLGGSFRADFVCYESVIVELKAIKELTDVEYAQVLHYLKATGLQRALLINFGADRLEYKRMVYTKTP